MNEWLLYGANGYTGALVARLAVARGLRPIVAGRNRTQVESLAAELSLPHRVFGLDAPAAVQQGVAGVQVVLNCAGPFARTAAPLLDACVANRVHYVDITGEITVFEALAARTRELRAAGVMALPGAGFDVVPTDCMAAHLARRLPNATSLQLAFRGGGGISTGTATTALESMAAGAAGMVRRDGALIPVPAAWKTRNVDFGRGPRTVVTIPWGDVSTAWHSTGIPNIEVYMAASPGMVRAMRAGRWAGPLLRLPGAMQLTLAALGKGRGPSESARAAARSHIWGRASAADGQSVAARLTTLDAYTFTAHSALDAVLRIGAGQVTPGFQTPSRAFGADWVLDIPTSVREDI